MSDTSVESIAKSGVLITDKLYQRPCKPPNLEAEVQLLRGLGQQLTRPPQAILKYLGCNQDTCNLVPPKYAGLNLAYITQQLWFEMLILS